jgi:RNase P subunit RPR2
MSGITRRCSNCGQNAQYVYTAEFRVGGTSGGMKLLFGEWAELGEKMIPLYVFVCPNCGKIELYATEELKQRANQVSNPPKP